MDMCDLHDIAVNICLRRVLVWLSLDAQVHRIIRLECGRLIRCPVLGECYTLFTWVINALELCTVWLYNNFDLSVTDDSYVDETRVWCIELPLIYY